MRLVALLQKHELLLDALIDKGVILIDGHAISATGMQTLFENEQAALHLMVCSMHGESARLVVLRTAGGVISIQKIEEIKEREDDETWQLSEH
ncbi:MAG: hypothetical protein ACRCX2_22115 [Paraclostridium sp.]